MKRNNINVDSQTFNALRKLADSEERTMAGQIRWLMRDWLKGLCKKEPAFEPTATGKKLILQVMLESGKPMSTSDIRARAEQLGCTLINYSGAIYAAREREEITTKKRLHSLTERGKMRARD
tara:strand:+ start:3374 stop:3739 length:366 start_codon:yes stop_codon:yes gene_type:complete